MTDPILLDVDGVCADFRLGLLRAVSSALHPDQIDHYDIFTILGSDRQQAEIACDDSDFWRSLPPIDGIAEAVGRLRAVREVVFVTSPWHSCKGWEHARRAWLREHLHAEPGMVIAASRKDLIVGATLIDDRPEHVDPWAVRHGRRAYLVDTTYNQTPKAAPRVKRVEWPAAASIIADRLARP